MTNDIRTVRLGPDDWLEPKIYEASNYRDRPLFSLLAVSSAVRDVFADHPLIDTLHELRRQSDYGYQRKFCTLQSNLRPEIKAVNHNLMWLVNLLRQLHARNLPNDRAFDGMDLRVGVSLFQHDISLLPRAFRSKRHDHDAIILPLLHWVSI